MVVKQRLDINLGKIEYNAGMRSIAKLCLNSLWGKFGQRINLTQTRYVTEPKEFYEILLDETLDDLNIQFLTNDMIQMNYNIKNKFVDNHNNTNIFVAAFTTSHAREMLYNVLDKLGDQVLGYDTDSCWYVEKPGGNTIDTGDSLGDLTDELEGDHSSDRQGLWYLFHAASTRRANSTRHFHAASTRRAFSTRHAWKSRPTACTSWTPTSWTPRGDPERDPRGAPNK